jgi:hypothetical protein
MNIRYKLYCIQCDIRHFFRLRAAWIPRRITAGGEVTSFFLRKLRKDNGLWWAVKYTFERFSNVTR